MEMLDYISQYGDDSEDTQLNFEKNETIVQKTLNPLSCYSLTNGKWTRQEIPEEINRMRMGKNPYECEFKLIDPLADDIHVIIQKSGNSWFVMDSGKKDLMKVNGFAKRQLHLKQNQIALVQIGGVPYIFSTKAQLLSRDGDDYQGETLPLEESQYSLSYQNKTVNCNLNELSLIGSDPICDFNIPGESFVAVISNLGKRLFLTSLVDNDKLAIDADGVPADKMPPLKPGSIISIGNITINFKLSKDLRFTQSFNYTPDTKGACMKLLEVDAYGNTGHGYLLPAAGRSIKVGRNSNDCLIAISHSSKISRIHGQAIVYEKSVMIIDNGSTNGTYVNGQRIKRHLAHPGDFVKFGDVTFIVCFA